MTLQQRGVPIRTFRVDDFGAPRYPELILTTTHDEVAHDPSLVQKVVDATRQGYAFAAKNPAAALDDLLASDPELARSDQRAQLDALENADAFSPPADFLNQGAHSRWLQTWPRWEADNGIVKRPPDLGAMISFAFQPGAQPGQ